MLEHSRMQHRSIAIGTSGTALGTLHDVGAPIRYYDMQAPNGMYAGSIGVLSCSCTVIPFAVELNTSESQSKLYYFIDCCAKKQKRSEKEVIPHYVNVKKEA